LPNLLLLVTFSLPLLTDDLGDIRIVKTRITSSNSLLVVLPIKDERYRFVVSRLSKKGCRQRFLSLL
jgi:hypothetical protein